VCQLQVSRANHPERSSSRCPQGHSRNIFQPNCRTPDVRNSKMEESFSIMSPRCQLIADLPCQTEVTSTLLPCWRPLLVDLLWRVLLLLELLWGIALLWGVALLWILLLHSLRRVALLRVACENSTGVRHQTKAFRWQSQLSGCTSSATLLVRTLRRIVAHRARDCLAQYNASKVYTASTNRLAAAQRCLIALKLVLYSWHLI